MSQYPEALKYTKEHEWVKLEGDVAVVGITHFAQDALGDVVFIDFPKVSTAVKQSGQAGTIESVKAVSDIYSPLSGEISEINTPLNKSPADVNQDPYGKGWLFKLSKINPTEIGQLMTAQAYQDFLKTL